MTSEQAKTMVKYKWEISSPKVLDDGFDESPPFGLTYSSSSFYLRLTKEGQLFLHLATCWQEKLHIDKFDVETCKPFESKNSIRPSLCGDIHLNGKTQLWYSLPADHFSGNWNFWHIECTVTYEEPDVKVDHEKKLIDQLAALRMNSEHSDVTLVTVADGQEHRAHKLILSIRSPVFAAMFKYEGMVENVLNRVEIEDISGEAMRAFLKYIYSGDTSMVISYAGELFELANKYDVQPLAQACIKRIWKDNAAQLYYLTDLHQQVNYKRMVMRFISTNMRAVKWTKGWSQFVEPHAKLLNELIDYLL